MRILLVEDHPQLGPDLKRGLERQKYLVDLVNDGEDALSYALTQSYQLLILDILLPGLSGLEVCRYLRARRSQVPILFLTALGKTEQRITGLDQGGDDYLVKPFDFAELEARVRALLRRASTEKTAHLRFCDLCLDTQTHEVSRGGQLLTLSHKEYLLLEYFMYHPRQVLSRTMIAEAVWEQDAEQFSNVIDVYIYYLRSRLSPHGEPNLIHTIRGAGYQLKEPE